ncbi:AraC family transcriptional regulator [Paenibacillus hodogayensis]|uniref:AraC family transcriptional regulator n=1 Tax=Paenibacillus hodogayensis TaxID=279208 RepID=A0ABV5VT59_9BACL
MAIKWIDLSRNPIYIYEQKHMGGHNVSEHHHQSYQILFVLDGQGSIRLDGGETQELKADDTALLVPFSVHAVMSDSRLTLLVLAFDETALDPETAGQLLHGHLHTSMLMKPSLFTGSELRQQLRKLLFEQSKEPSALGTLSMRIQLSQLLLTLTRAVQTSTGTGSNRQRAEKIRSYIDSHYFEPLTAADIASKLGISTRHVNNIFKERYDMTPMQYLTEARIRLAQKLLAETDKDIISICFEAGYDSVSTFYRSFKAVAKLSPKSYRQMNRPTDVE